MAIPSQSFGLVEDKVEANSRTSKSNWIHAGSNVLVWNTVLIAHTSLPIAAFHRSFDAEPKYISDNTWEWTYKHQTSADLGGKLLDVSLTGQYISNTKKVHWNMTVAESDTDNTAVWISGVSSVEDWSGNFEIYEIGNNGQPYLGLSYRIDEDQSRIIHFENIRTDNEGFGDYIEWKTEMSTTFDRAYNINLSNKMIEIQSNSSDDSGRVKDQLHFGDADWHCWDMSKTNIEC